MTDDYSYGCDPAELEEFERLLGNLPPVASLDGAQRAFLNAIPVGREIYWRDEVLDAPLPEHLKDLNLDDVDKIHGLSLWERVRVIRAGIPAQAFLGVLKAFGSSRVPNVLGALGVDIEETFEKAYAEQMLDMSGSEKALGLIRLLGHLRQHGSGSMSFGDFGLWLVTWHPALDLAPIDFVGSVTGQAYLEDVISAGNG